MGVDVIPNSPENIKAVAIEADERLNGTWQPCEEDEDLQSRFVSVFGASRLGPVFRARISADFLRQNRELLDG